MVIFLKWILSYKQSILTSAFFLNLLIKGDKNNSLIAFLVFGLIGISSGLSSILLPETLGRNLPSTIKEAETIKIIRLAYY